MKIKEKVEVKVDCKDKSAEKILSTDQKVKEQNRIRQLAKKAREKMPKDYKSFCMVAAHPVRNAHHYYDGNPDENRLEMMEVNGSAPQSKLEVEDKCKAVNQKLRYIRTLKRQNRIR